MTEEQPGTGDEARTEIDRLVQVMDTLRHHCPWDAHQTHRSLVPYLIEETCEVVEAIEADDRVPPDDSPVPVTSPDAGESAPAAQPDEHLREELGDLLFQVIFHSAIAGERDAGFDVADVARDVADKLIARHPAIYTAGAADDTDGPVERVELREGLDRSWEERKAREKGRQSVLDAIPEQFSALARANKIITRARARAVPVTLPDDPIDADELGRELIRLVARAQASGINTEQAGRDAARELESRVAQAEHVRQSSPGEISAQP